MKTLASPAIAIGGNFLANIVLIMFCTVAEMRVWWLKQPYIPIIPISPNFSLYQHTLQFSYFLFADRQSLFKSTHSFGF